MTIDEAIKDLDNLERQPIVRHWTASREAIKLGIEALNLYKDIHGIAAVPLSYMLPGETKD